MRLFSLVCVALSLAATAAPVDLPSLFDKRALVKPITEIEGILSDGSKATVYNTLNLFAAKGVIRQLAVDGDRAWFDSNTEPHYHFQDIETGALTDLAPQEVRFDRLPPPPPGMEYAGVELFIRLRRV